MNEKKFVVVSGHPAGEVAHRGVFGPYTEAEAERVRKEVDAAIAAGGNDCIGSAWGNWLWGPHVQEMFPNVQPETWTP